MKIIKISVKKRRGFALKKLAFDDKLPNRSTGAALSVGKINCAADYYEVR